jgi:hypothetical protein
VLDKKSPERLHALERGFSLALRDGNLDQAAGFAALLDTEGHPEYRELLGEERSAHDDALIPGGLDAFAVIANVKQGTPSERFFANYARQVVPMSAPTTVSVTTTRPQFSRTSPPSRNSKRSATAMATL